MVIEPALVDSLEEFGAQPLESAVWRHYFAGRDPLLPSTAGGRWSPPRQFSVLYTLLSREGAVVEGQHVIGRYSIPPSRERRICRIAARLGRVVDLRPEPRLAVLAIESSRFVDALDRCAEIGSAASFLEYQGLLVPSARHPDGNLVVLADQLDPQCELQVVDDGPLQS